MTVCQERPCSGRDAAPAYPAIHGPGRSGPGRVIKWVYKFSFNLGISPKMSFDVLECDTVMLQNYMLMIL